jgi:hypothetical protein
MGSNRWRIQQALLAQLRALDVEAVWPVATCHTTDGFRNLDSRSWRGFAHGAVTRSYWPTVHAVVSLVGLVGGQLYLNTGAWGRPPNCTISAARY